ncbi:hypothetical protein PG994_012381 [Apiospora phragmitis]|uniref:RRM domain-containing protein n=1 Tax=Apiospora phragmitis TaxID=2905665 RepID=A0ABR1TVH1_9PEZI
MVSSSSNQATTRHEGSEEQLVWHPGIWQSPINPPALDTVTVVRSEAQHYQDRQGRSNLTYQTARDNWFYPRSEMGNAVHQRPEATTVVGQHPEVVSSIGQRYQPIDTVDRHHGSLDATNRLPDANLRTAYPPARITGRRNGSLPYDPNFEFSDNYRGSRKSRANYSANVEDTQNCSVFIRGLPPTCRPFTLLQHIRGCGTKINALHINQPDRDNPHHCAAKLVFFQRCGVDWLFAQIRSGHFVIPGDNGVAYTPNAVYNKIRSAPMQPDDRRSRVVIVGGPDSIVSVGSMDAFFSSHFYYEADTAFVTLEQPGWRVIEFHFSSMRCQSENAVQALERLTIQGPESFSL